MTAKGMTVRGLLSALIAGGLLLLSLGYNDIVQVFLIAIGCVYLFVAGLFLLVAGTLYGESDET